MLDSNIYLTLTGTTFIPPTNPGLVPVIVGNTRIAQVVAQENAHEEHLREYKECVKVDKAILQLRIGAFESKCLCHLHN